MHYVEISAAVAALTMLVTHSKLFAPVRSKLPEYPFHCPICLSFWVAAPMVFSGQTLYESVVTYLATVTCSNLFMFGIAKLYLAIDDMDCTPE